MMRLRQNIAPSLLFVAAAVGWGCTASDRVPPASRDAAVPPAVRGDASSSEIVEARPRADAAATSDAPSSVGGADGSTTTPTDAGTGAACEGGAVPVAGGATIDVRPPSTIAAALAAAHPGDRVVLHAGSYTREQLTGRAFADFVFIEAAPGENVTLPGARFQRCDHLAFRGVRFSATVMLDGSSNFVFRDVTLDGGATEEAALQIHGQGAAGASHDVLVADSRVLGGGRTVFVLGVFAPSAGWNHHLTFVRNDITCGSHNCFQISGGRDMVIADNRINGTTTAGVLSAGGTRLSIVRNRFHGMGSRSPAAIQLASPGAEWDNYAGVENMITSAVVVANNVIDGWATAVQLDAARDIAIVHDTVADGVGVRLNHRTPHDQAGNVILNGNSDVRVWNDILPSISVATGEARPGFESHNLVGGTPGFAAAGDFTLAADSPALDAALVNAETPADDFDHHLRGAAPDIGARERGATTPACEGQP